MSCAEHLFLDLKRVFSLRAIKPGQIGRAKLLGCAR